MADQPSAQTTRRSRWVATSGHKTRVTTDLDMAAHLDTLGWDVEEVVPCDEAAIERAARAQHDHDPWVYGQDQDGEDIHKPWDGAPPSVQDYYRESVRAAFAGAANA